MKKIDEDEPSPSVFYYPKDLETFESATEPGITECHIINYLCEVIYEMFHILNSGFEIK